MNRLAVWTFVSSLSLASLAAAPSDAAAAKAKAKATSGKSAGKGKAAAAAPPNANAEEIDKLKGEFKWGMTVDEVQKAVEKRVRDSYAEDLKKALKDPTQYSRMRSQMEKEVKAIKSNYVKFEGKKTGYDVSIVDQEFSHKNDESMLVARDDKNTRYYFFVNERLYKIFIAFGKEMLEDKSFTDFGQLMQARFGKAKAVMVEEAKKGGVEAKLDHYVWASAAGDGLRLVDRSEFYDVYCLVIYDGKESERLAEVRARQNGRGDGKDSLVEAALAGNRGTDDVNANIIDQIAGKNYAKPGRAEDIVVPSTNSGSSSAPTPQEVNAKPAGGANKKKASPDLEL